MPNPIHTLLWWFVAVMVVFVIALIQNAVHQGRRFSVRHLLLFTTLVAIVLGLLATIWQPD